MHDKKGWQNIFKAVPGVCRHKEHERQISQLPKEKKEVLLHGVLLVLKVSHFLFKEVQKIFKEEPVKSIERINKKRIKMLVSLMPSERMMWRQSYKRIVVNIRIAPVHIGKKVMGSSMTDLP